jgi:hypothetical protein
VTESFLHTPDAFYAWCFDHGRLHRFLLAEGTWCTAAWVPLVGSTEAEALSNKKVAWGDAQFFDQLTLDRQGGLIALADQKKELLANRPTPLPEEMPECR